MSGMSLPGRRAVRIGRRGLVLLVTLVVMATTATSAWAYWTTVGTGTGSATTGTLGAPTGVAASTSGVATGSVEVSWTAPTGTQPMGYYVTRTPAGGGMAVAACGSSAGTLLSASSCTDSGMQDGSYTYAVTAVLRSWSATSGQSGQVTVVTDTTPPTTAILRSPAGDDATWNSTDVLVTLSATDAGSGVKEVHYAINGGAEQVVSGSSTSFTVSREDSNALAFWAVDKAGNAEAPHNTASVKIDKTAPTTSLGLSSSSTPSAGYYTADVSVSLSATDVSPDTGAASSGVTSVRYALNSAAGPWTTYAGPFKLGSDGTTTIYYTSTDLAGNAETTKTQIVKIDKTAPVTAPALVGTPGANGWYTSGVQLTLSGQDATSGLGNTEYSLTGSAPWTLYTGPLSISSQGTTTVTFRSTDVAGNVEANKSQAVKIDSAAPSTSASMSGTQGTNGWYTSNVNVTLTGLDAASGVAKTEYSLTGGASWTPYGGPVLVTTEGSTTVTFRSTDIAGNVEAKQSQTIKIDKTAPTKPSITSISNDTGAWSSDGITNVSNQSISGSSEPNAQVVLSRGGIQLGTATANAAGNWTVNAVALQEGANSLTATARDDAGNLSSASDAYVATLDTVAPTGSFTAPASSGTSMTSQAYKNECAQNFAVCGTAADDSVGLSSVTATVVKGANQNVGTTFTGTLAAWTFGTGNLQSGTYTVTVVLTDKAGNGSQVATVFRIL